jgi:site-specific recombinase XerC
VTGVVATPKVNDLSLSAKAGELARLQVKGREDKERPVWLMPETVAVLETYLAKRSAVEDDALFIASVVQGYSPLLVRLPTECNRQARSSR